MAVWWKSNKEGEEDKIELPKEIQEQLNQTAALKTEVSEMKTKLSQLDSISDWIKEQREAAVKPKPKPQPTAEDEEAEAEELAALLLTNPKAAYARLAANTNAGMMLTRADNVKREVFGDQPEKFPYYSGEIKSEIDKILAEQSLEFRNNPTALENTYYTVVGKRQKEISEGKIKDRFASSTSGRRSSSVEEEVKRAKLEPNDDVIKIAKTLGIKLEDYMELLEKDAEAYI